MDKFWKIPKEWVQEWHLSAIECIVLADAAEWECSIIERAERCGIAERTVRNTIAGLSEKAVRITALSELLKAVKITAKSGKNYRTQNGKTYRLKRQNLPLKTAKLTANSKNLPHTPYKIYTDNTDNTDKGEARSPAREATENFTDKNSAASSHSQTPPPTPPPPDDYADTNTAWAEHYKAATGTDYQPVFQYHTDDMRWLAHAIRAKAANFGVQPTESIADFARSLFDHFRSIADKWQLSRWTTHTITNQFNELFEKTISNGKPNNGTDNCRISRDYLERTMREAGLM